MNAHDGPTAGLRVLDLSTDVAGGFCTKLLAAFGADVLKVEPPRSGDPVRAQPPFLHDVSHVETGAVHLYLDLNKRSVTLDRRHEIGRALWRELLARADVIVESGPPPAAGGDPPSIDFDDLHRARPDVVLVSVTPFGQDGPYRDRASSDLVSLALGGLLYITGDPAREPLRIGGQPAVYFAGLGAFAGTMAAVHVRDVSGEGQHVDVSELEGAAYAQMYSALRWEYQREQRMRALDTSPVLHARDGLVGLLFRQQNWAELCRMIGREDLVEDERFRDVQARREHAAALKAIVAEWMRTQSKEDVYHRAQAQRIPAGYICDAEDLLRSPQYRERGYFVEIDHPVAGRLTYPGMPLRMTGYDWPWRRAPLLGEHNEAVYRGELGHGEDELAAWGAADAI